MLNLSQTPNSFPGAVRVPREVRCLLLDDSHFDRARIRRLARQTDMSIQMDEVDSIAQLAIAVAKENYDIILIDYRLPIGDGMVALEHVMKSAQNRDAGKIMITGDGARQTAVKAMRAGCHDFLTKEEMCPEALREAITNALTTSKCRRNQRERAAERAEPSTNRQIIALQDNDVEEKLVSLDRARSVGRSRDGLGWLDASDVDVLLASLDDSDDVIIH